MIPKASPLLRARRARNLAALTLSTLATLFGLFWLAWILVTTVAYGAAALGPKLFTQLTPPPGSAGGLSNAIAGSAIILAIAVGIGAPIGVLAGTHLAEYGARSRITGVIRFLNDILLSAPSIIVGLFAYMLVVRTTGHFSAFAGAVALALILLPVVVRTTDETMRLVPVTLREAALALGTPKWKVIALVIWPAARTGILTGLLLGIARISGETAPLLFTALGNQYWSTDPMRPMANIPVVIFQFALSPYKEWHALAWSGALLMAAFVLIVSVGARLALSRRA